MPPKKTNVLKQMEARVEALESELSEVRSTLADVQNTVKENHASLFALLEKCLGKTLHVGEGSTGKSTATVDQGSPEKMKGTGGSFSNLKGDAMTEFRQSVKKVELPAFNGEDPAGWISRAEVYFRVQDTIPEVKVNLAQLCMEGPTIHFFNSLIGEDGELTWENLKEALLERYGGHGDGDVYEQLTELKQEGTVEEYILEFEYLIAQIPKLPGKQFLGYFLHGLKSEIRGKVRSLAAMGEMSRSKLLQVTRAVEKEVKGGNGSGFNRSSRFGNGSQRPGSFSGGRGSTDWVLVKGKEVGGSKGPAIGPKRDGSTHGDKKKHGPRDRGFTHLSYQELMERKQKGLCFKCGGAFHPMHQCPDKQLRVLVIENEEEENSDAKILAVEVEDTDEEEGGECSILNLHHIAQENHHTVKFQGIVRGVPVLILVDSGATHNFISQKLVYKMDWPVDDTPEMRIKLGDGYQTITKGICKKLEMSIGDFTLSPDLHLFELGGIDVVLGMEWLKTLGDTIINWRKQTMSFWMDKRWVTLQGLEDCRESMVALQSILRKSKQEVHGGFWGMEKHEQRKENQILTPGQQEELERLLHKFSQVFQEPTGLPPH